MKNPFGPAFWRGFLSMSAYGASHSLLASTAAKNAVGARVGERAFGTFYRLGYNAIALPTFVWLLASVLKRPGETVYEARGVWKWALRIVGAVALGYALWSGWQVGVGRLSGIGPLARGVLGASESDPPEGQSPSFAEGCPAGGPFSRHRQPLNFIIPFIFWGFSRGSQSFIGLNLAVTLYAILGSYPSDARLRERYGQKYRGYQKSVPFLWPRAGKAK